jgi:hypothetical protein
MHGSKSIARQGGSQYWLVIRVLCALNQLGRNSLSLIAAFHQFCLSSATIVTMLGGLDILILSRGVSLDQKTVQKAEAARFAIPAHFRGAKKAAFQPRHLLFVLI